MEHFGHRYRVHGNMLCPFHDEKNPSARLYEEQNTFWCWACSPDRGVDVIEYVILALQLTDELQVSLPSLSKDKVHGLATIRAIDYLEREFNVSFLAEPWEKRLMDALFTSAPKEDPQKYWRNSHHQVLRILAQVGLTSERAEVYATAMRNLLMHRRSPVTDQRPLWNQLRQELV